MGLLSRNRRGTDLSLPKSDRGFGHLDDYGFNLVANNKNTTMTLAGSDPYQDELRTLAESGDQIETAISPRTLQQERTDDEIVVRVFTGRRVSGPVGSVPRGLESIVDETLRRLGDGPAGKTRIPVRIVQKRGVYRVELLMGAVRR